MSKLNAGSSFFKRNAYQLEIKTKTSKKNKTNSNKSNSNKSNRVSDDDFNELMKENKPMVKNEIKLKKYLDEIKDSEMVEQLIQEQLIGEDLVCRIESENISGSQLLKGILKKYNTPSNYNWVQPEQYGKALSFVLSNNIQEQLMCLFLIQDYSTQFEFPKITYKDKQVYFIKTIFQLFFTLDIIEESTFWKWQDLLVDIVDIGEETKNKICIQTTEFFNILKMTFVDEDYEEKEDDKNDDKKLNKPNKESDSDSDSDSEKNNELNKYNIPQEQDYNMDDDNFNLDDL